MPRSVQGAAAWSWRLLLIGLGVAALTWLLVQVEIIVVPIAVAVLLTVLLSPVVHGLTRVRVPHGLAAGLAVILLIGVVVGLVTLAGSSIANGIAELSDQAVQGVSQVTTWLSDGPLQVSQTEISGWVDELQDAASDASSTLVSGALTVTTTIGHVLAGTLITLFCTFFFLKDGREIWAWVVGLLPTGSRHRVHEAGRRGVVTLSGYARTQILVAAVDAVGIGAGAAILQVPLAVPLGILVFVGSFVPVVGSVVTGVVAVLVALVAQGPVWALAMLGVVVLVQQIEGHVLQPFLMGHAVSLHPVAVILAVATGSFVAGIVGALFAVPFAAVVNTVVLYLHGHDKFPELGEEGVPTPARVVDQPVPPTAADAS